MPTFRSNAWSRLSTRRDPTARHPLFQVSLAFQSVVPSATEVAGLRISAFDATLDSAKFDLSVTVRESAGLSGLEIEWLYATDLFDASTVTAFAGRLSRILVAAVADPSVAVGDISILDGSEHDELLARMGGAATPAIPLTALLADAAERDPSRVAVVGADGTFTYRELQKSSNALARLLIERGVGPESVVALAMGRGTQTVRAMWAIAASGAAFVPIDPSYPRERIAYMISDSGARVGLTTGSLLAGLPEWLEWVVIDDEATATPLESYSSRPITDQDRVRPLRIQHPAYLIYTSGSTGTPKGVVVTHEGIATLVHAQRERFGDGPDERQLAVASPSFDAAVMEFLLAYGSAATLVVSPPDVFGGPELAKLLREQRVTRALITPSVLTSLEPSGLDALETLIAGGEAIGPDVVARWAPGRRLLNAYGPTEATIWVSSSTSGLRVGEPVTIGSPIDGSTVLVLDDRLHPVPMGVIGELYVAGISLARGYRALPAVTAERFVANPVGSPGERMYRTGDLVRWTAVPDGRTVGSAPTRELTYAGRSDFQVKVRGLRIELGEIDAALAAHANVDVALTVGHTGDRGTAVLVSYVVVAAGATHRSGRAARIRRRPAPRPHGAHRDHGDRSDSVDSERQTGSQGVAGTGFRGQGLPSAADDGRAHHRRGLRRSPRYRGERGDGDGFGRAKRWDVHPAGGTRRFVLRARRGFASCRFNWSRGARRAASCSRRGDVFEQRTVAGLAAVAGVDEVAAVVELPELARWRRW